MEIIQLGGVPIRPQQIRIKRSIIVATAEFNVICGAFRYLPFSTGLLRAFALTEPAIRDHVQFMPFLYELDTLPAILAKITAAPDVFAVSVSMWNEQLSLVVGRAVKQRWPDCLVIFGGCHVPHHPTAYMEQHPFIDVCVRSEGEEAFRDLLLRRLADADYTGIPDVTYRDGAGQIIENLEHRAYSKDLDGYPSPYVSGLFDYLLQSQSDNHKFQCIIETNRGCPFSCSFCYWAGGGLMTKYRFHSLDYVKDELDFVGRAGCRYTFLADSNFAMHPRDKEIAEHAVRVKQKYGAPEKLRVCWGKNTDEKVYQVASILHRADMEKGITLARQSNDAETLKNIRRDNIKLSTYQTLQRRFMEQNVPTYTELILGLPGETVASWKKGVDEVLTSVSMKAQLFIYLCQVLPNTELWRPEYRQQHGIRTRPVELQEIHGSRRPPEWTTEYEELVLETATLPYRDWRYLCKFSWMTMLLHSMKTGFFVLAWLWDRWQIPPSAFIDKVVRHDLIGNCSGLIHSEVQRWDTLLDRLSVFGEGRGQILDGYGDIYWDVEEAALLRMAENWVDFYADLEKYTRGILNDYEDRTRGAEYNRQELWEVLIYQRGRMPDIKTASFVCHLAYNIPEYFNRLFSDNPVLLVKKPQILTLKPKDWHGDRERFARETILWGRKSGTMLVECEWRDA